MNLFDRIIEAVVPSNPDIAVQLAGKYADVPQHVEGKSFTLTQKLDGTRGVLVKRGDDVSLWSRHGKPINGFESVMEDLAKAPGSYVIDGELLPRGWQKMTNDEQFKKALSGKSGKVADKTTMVLAAFDLIDIKEWDAKHSTTPYIERRKRLD
jgi:ATP-dependent DNA ligase